MTDDLTQKIERLYNHIVELPNKQPEKFDLINSGYGVLLVGAHPKISYCSLLWKYTQKEEKGQIVNYETDRGIGGRLKLWKDFILPEWYGSEFEETAKKENIGYSISNRLFHSRLHIQTSDAILDLWGPKGRFVGLTPKIKARLKRK